MIRQNRGGELAFDQLHFHCYAIAICNRFFFQPSAAPEEGCEGESTVHSLYLNGFVLSTVDQHWFLFLFTDSLS